MLLSEEVWEPLLAGDGGVGGKPEEPCEILATSEENNYKNSPFTCQPPWHKNKKKQTFQRSTGLFLLHSEGAQRWDMMASSSLGLSKYLMFYDLGFKKCDRKDGKFVIT